MQSILAGIGNCKGFPIHYYLLEERSAGGKMSYGIQVVYRDETAVITQIGRSYEQIMALLECLSKGDVTPVSVRDIVEDWLLR